MNLLHVVGARPNFVKLAGVYHALRNAVSWRQVLVHTGQHYDPAMSDVVWQQLGLPASNVNLNVGSGTHAAQTAEVMIRLEPVLLRHRPDIVVVYGDVNSTLAAALVCSKLQIPVAHVEAGLRSFDRTMPEEINRVLTDQIADLHFTHSPDADLNLLREGIAAAKIQQVGNVMIDSLVRLLPLAMKVAPSWIPERFALVTLHRPSNVDDSRELRQIMNVLGEISSGIEVLFPVHPRTRQKLADGGFKVTGGTRVHLVDPQPYVTFLALEQRATFVITDSGWVQEETTFLGVPCLTVRESTERPITASCGTNVLVGRNMEVLRQRIDVILGGSLKPTRIPPGWDGHAGERIAEALQEYLASPPRVSNQIVDSGCWTRTPAIL